MAQTSSSLQIAARFADALPDDMFWRTLHALADTAYPPLFRTVAEILTQVGPSINRAHLTETVSAGNRLGAEAELQRAWESLGVRGLQERVIPQLRDLALTAAEATPLEVGFSFHLQNAESLAAIDAGIGADIVGISATTREAIQGIVRNAFESGLGIREQTQEIQELIGLTPRMANQMANYRSALLEQGIKPSKIETLVARRTRGLRRQRAEAISRTESMRAANIGAHERLVQSISEGLLDAGKVRRLWVLVPDDRLCRYCQQLVTDHPDGVAVDAFFTSVLGDVLYPPLHVQCRCIVSVQFL